MKTLRRLTMVLASGGALLLSIGLHTDTAEAKCGHFPASGQTTAHLADKLGNTLATVPDDGTVQAGKTLKYKDNGDRTITDQVTGLIWEKKCENSATCPTNDLHNVFRSFQWSNFGAETIWDWLDDLNAANFAGHDDWRIPNVKELQSIVDYEEADPSIDPVFGPTFGMYWSSTTTSVSSTGHAWGVGFGGDGVESFGGFDNGSVRALLKSVGNGSVRAVRGGCS